MRPILAIPALAGLLAACDLPKDPDGTLARVEHGELRAGIFGAGAVAQARRAAVAELAAALDASPHFFHGDPHRLIADLREGRLDLIAALPADTPFAPRLALTLPLSDDGAGDPQVWAVPPGENGFLHRVDAYLLERVRR